MIGRFLWPALLPGFPPPHAGQWERPV